MEIYKIDQIFDMIEHNEIDKLKPILSNGFDVNMSDKDNYTLLHMAIDFGKEKAARLLLTTPGIEVNCCTNFHELTPIHFAAQDGRTNLVNLLLDFGANINSLNHTNCTPIYFAVCGNHMETVKLLISRGADLNIRDTNNISPLLQAVSISTAITELLLDNNAQTSDYCRELHTTLLSNKPEIANLILDRLSGPLTPNRIGRSVLQNAVANINCDPKLAVDLVDKIIKLGDDINYSNQYGTIVHILIQRNAFHKNDKNQDLTAQALFAYLISNENYDIDQFVSTNGSGTPLTLAFKLNQYSFAESLIKAGSDVNLCNLSDFKYTKDAESVLKLIFHCGYSFDETFVSRSRPLNDEDLISFEKFCSWLKTDNSKLMSLKFLVRIFLRNLYKNKIRKIMSNIQCPQSLKSFVLFDL